jgi:hypothetical protein
LSVTTIFGAKPCFLSSLRDDDAALDPIRELCARKVQEGLYRILAKWRALELQPGCQFYSFPGITGINADNPQAATPSRHRRAP